MRTSSTITLLILAPLLSVAQPAGNVVSLSNAFFTPSEKTVSFKTGDRLINLKVIQYGAGSDFVCINLHDNESTSVEAARSILEQKGGTMIKIENFKQRVIRFKLKGVTYGFDPNRIYSRIGIEQTLRDNRRSSPAAIAEVERFANYVLSLIPDSAACIIALHNNTEGAYSVKSYQPGGDRQFDAKAVYADSLQDIDDIVFTTDSLLYQRMADLHYNSIWQDNEKVKRDGSLSVYFAEKGRRYANIETQHGRVAQYAEMLEKLLAILSEENKPVAEPSTEAQ